MSLLKYLNPNAIKDGSIEGTKIKDSSIEGAKIKDGSISLSKIDSMCKLITWSELKSLRNNGRLVPGQKYRITDYQCTTTQKGTKSAGHQFDIIVTADSESILNEEARAIKHLGDNYFSYFYNCDLDAWKIWYCIYNDTTRFKWADETNGKGVIYRMIDEWNNDVPYDFKNIIYIVVPYFLFSQNYSEYTIYKFTRDVSIDMSIDGTQYYGYISEYTPYGFENNECWVKEENPSIDSVLYKRDGSVINFKAEGTLIKVSSATYETYTFGKKEDKTVNSQDGYFACHNNIIAPYYLKKNKLMSLNNNTFDSSCDNNILGYNCCNNTFDIICNNNSFGSGCENNSFGDNCSNNIFGNNCGNNTVGDGCTNNTFGNNCYNNSFGDYCSQNSFGNNCYNNLLNYKYYNNSFGNNCQYIKLASDSSASATKYNYYRYNHFGDGCKYILFKGTETASDSAQVQNYKFAQSLQGTPDANLTVDGKRNKAFETKVARNSNGDLKIYCEADLIQ